MKVHEALSILNLPSNYTQHELKKQYYKLSLQYHPDKNPHGEEMFKTILESYNLLCHPDMQETYMDPLETLQQYLKYVLDIDHDTFMFVQNLINTSYQKTNETLKTIDANVLKKVRRVLTMYQKLFKMTDINIYDFVSKTQDIHKKDVIIQPSLDDIMNHSVHIVQHEGNEFYIPSWHHQLEYEDMIVTIIPESLDHIYIDDDTNDIHVNLSISQTKVFEMETLQFVIGSCTFHINIEELYLKKYQQFYFKKKGIPKINENDIFLTNDISDIIVHVNIS